MAALFGGGKSNKQSAAASQVMRVQTSSRGLPIPFGWGQAPLPGNLIWYGDFLAVPHTAQVGGKGGMAGGGGKNNKSTSFTYQAAVDIALCEGPIDSIQGMWNNKSKTTLAAMGFTALTGGYAQTAWAYLTTNHPADAFNYRGIAHVGAGPLQLGTTDGLPNMVFDVRFTYNSAISGLPDADPKDVVNDLLTNVHYGVLGFPSALLASMTTYSAYCRATGMVVSPTMIGQTTAASFLDDLMLATNSEIVWNGGTFTVVPYGDTAITAHGSTYTPPAAPVYGLADDDFLPNQAVNSGSSSSSSSSDPVVVTRRPQSLQLNQVRVEFEDRANEYDLAVADARDDGLIAAYTLRPSDLKKFHFFKDADAANTSAQLMLGRQWVAATYAFTLDPGYILLDPMDIVAIPGTLLETQLGAAPSLQWVRIKEITENSDGSLSVVAEEYLNGTGHRPLYSRQTHSGITQNYMVAPGNVNTPIIFNPPIGLAPTDLELWILASGVDQVNWGGYEVWMSYTGSNYRYMGRMVGNARTGVVSSNYTTGGATLSLNFTESSGVITATHADADKLTPLLLIGTEVKSFGTATLTSAFHYDTSYFYNSLYGTGLGTGGSYLAGVQVAMLDNEHIFHLPIPADRIGSTVYIKLASFNVYGQAVQDLSTCTQYTYAMPGPPALYGPVIGSTFAVGELRGVAVVWTNTQTSKAIDHIEVWGSNSSSFGAGALIATLGAGATFVVDQVTPLQQRWYWVRYIDRAGNPGYFDPPSAGAGATATALQAVSNDVANANILTAHAVTNMATIHNDLEATGSIASTGSFASLLGGGFSYTSDGGVVTINGLFWIFNTDTGSHNYQFQLLIGGSVVYPQHAMTAGLTAVNGAWVAVPFAWVATPGAGSHSFDVQWKSNDGTTALNAYNVILNVDEIKR
jgi:hypothetical protein